MQLTGCPLRKTVMCLSSPPCQRVQHIQHLRYTGSRSKCGSICYRHCSGETYCGNEAAVALLPAAMAAGLFSNLTCSREQSAVLLWHATVRTLVMA